MRQDFSRPESASSSLNSISAIKFNGFPWDHTALRVGSVFHSVHPENPSVSNKESKDVLLMEEDDLPYKFNELWNNIIKPMCFSKMTFRSEEELASLPHEEVEIPVTPAEFQRVQQVIQEQKEQAMAGKLRYSVFDFLGMSCSKSNQQVLDAIVKETPEQPLAQPSVLERFIKWPAWTHERASKIAESRQSSALPKP